MMNVATSSHDSLLVSFIAAAIVHAVVILGVGFTQTPAVKSTRPLEITLADSPVKTAPKKAQFLAQANQLGGGPTQQKPKPEQKAVSGRPEPSTHAKPQVEKQKPKPAPKIIVQHKTATENTPAPAQEVVETAPKVERSPSHLSPLALAQQVHELGTKIRNQQLSADLSKIKHVRSVSAHHYLASQYEKDWENKVERTGNLNYPEIARSKGFKGKLTMEVGIKADGSLYNIRIKQSSGIPGLDKAAEKIVRMCAPFAPLPPELLDELDVLIITRVWKFSDESGLNAD
ncbi:MAG: TonB family protein [Methylococcales bacterium]|nr:TonB family protein [Methylococcales bacterium]